MTREPRPVDAVVVGAGFSGLAAADALAQAGLSYVVLEGQPEAGGRTRTTLEEYGYIDLGAAYAGDHQNFLNMYMQRFGIETIKVHSPADETWLYQHADGQVEDLPGDDPYVLPRGMAGDDRALMTMYTLNQLSIQVRAVLDRPWAALNASLWDGMTVADWMNRTLTDPKDRTTRDLLTVAVQAVFSAEPSQISFLWFLYYSATSGCFQNVVGVTSDPEGWRFKYGSRSLVDALADAVGRDNIRMGEAVRRITQDDSGVTVETDRQRYRAREVIVCMSPATTLKIAYDPPLAELPGGPERLRLCQNMPMGSIIKVFVHYRTPFWRRHKRSGYALAMQDDVRAPLVWTLDNCWEPAPGEPAEGVKYPHSLMGFIVGDKADHWRTRPLAERQQAVIEHLAALYGPEARTELVEEAPYHEKDWSADPWAGGGPCGHLRPGILSTCGAALRKPIGRLHWAGTEAGTEWCGYITGALQSGVAAASAVVEKVIGARRA